MLPACEFILVYEEHAPVVEAAMLGHWRTTVRHIADQRDLVRDTLLARGVPVPQAEYERVAAAAVAIEQRGTADAAALTELHAALDEWVSAVAVAVGLIDTRSAPRETVDP